MTMKRTELEKRQGLKIVNAQRTAGNSYGSAASGQEDRKARRERERAAGLVPFAVKLPKELVAALHAEAQSNGVGLDALVGDLLFTALRK